jgi:hypothetical protein
MFHAQELRPIIAGAAGLSKIIKPLEASWSASLKRSGKPLRWHSNILD